MSQLELTKITDEGGHTLNVSKYKGRLWPRFPREAIEGFADFKLREDDVIIMAYPKSGTHWLFEIIRFLIAGTVDLPVVEKEDTMIEFSGHKDVKDMPGPRNLNTHCHFDQLPSDTFSKKPKLIYLTRDPRDVAVSHYNHHRKLRSYCYKGEWNNYFPLHLEGRIDYESWFTYTRKWEEGMKNNPELPVYVTSYENLQAETEREIDRIAKFIGVKADEALVKQIKEKSSFDSMKASKGHVIAASGDDQGKKESVMYRKGKVGDWKNWFTVAQSEVFNQVFEKEMKGTNAYKLYSHTRLNQNESADTNTCQT